MDALKGLRTNSLLRRIRQNGYKRNDSVLNIKFSPAVLPSASKSQSTELVPSSNFLSSAIDYVMSTMKRKRDAMFDSSPFFQSSTVTKPKFKLGTQSLPDLWQSHSPILPKIHGLPNYIRSPTVTSLHSLTSHHISTPPSLIAFNVGGLHFFQHSSILQQFRYALLSNNTDSIRSFFESYGYAEGCAMSLYLAISDPDLLYKKAIQTALCYANLPYITPQGEFQPSSIHDGLVSLLSRLLRPFWFKPFVLIHDQTVFFITNDPTLFESLRKPLYALAELMRRVFGPAVNAVPFHPDTPSDTDQDSALMTRAMQLATQRYTTEKMSSSHVQHSAKMKEETSLHLLYRVLTRSLQFLNLVQCLYNAKNIDVEWGMLHGISCADLITKREGHDRIQSLLLSLVTSTDDIMKKDALAKVLGEQCYLFFSLGDRYMFEAFAAVKNALEREEVALYWSERAALLFRKAAVYWKSPNLVCGQILQRNDQDKSRDTDSPTKQAAQSPTSPVARAADSLMSIQNLRGVVDVCLITAANFGGTIQGTSAQDDIDEDALPSIKDMMQWEVGLYHRSNPTEPLSPALAGTEAKPDDARMACYSVLFHHLNFLLRTSPSQACQMLSECASSADIKFQHALYSYLMKHSHVETLLRIQTPTLENWLSDQNDANLLYRYYIMSNRSEDASRVMLQKATSTDPSLPLYQRMECLTRSLSCSPSPSLNQKIQEVLDHASLQKRLLARVDTSQLTPEEKQNLEYTLINISDLFNGYAAPKRLYDLCLIMLKTCDHEGLDTVYFLWKMLFSTWVPLCCNNKAVEEVLKQELLYGTSLQDSVDTFDNNNLFEDGIWVNSFKDNFIQLGKELCADGVHSTFPVGFLVQKLIKLQSAFQQVSSNAVTASQTPWSVSLLLEVGVPYIAILDAYSDWYQDAARDVHATPSKIVECLTSIAKVLQQWVDAAISSNRIDSMSDDSNASTQLHRALSSGLRTYIDGWKASLEEIRGYNTQEISNALLMFTEVEKKIQMF